MDGIGEGGVDGLLFWSQISSLLLVRYKSSETERQKVSGFEHCCCCPYFKETGRDHNTTSAHRTSLLIGSLTKANIRVIFIQSQLVNTIPEETFQN